MTEAEEQKMVELFEEEFGPEDPYNDQIAQIFSWMMPPDRTPVEMLPRFRSYQGMELESAEMLPEEMEEIEKMKSLEEELWTEA